MPRRGLYRAIMLLSSTVLLLASAQPSIEEPDLTRALFLARDGMEEERALGCSSFRAEVVRGAATLRTTIAIEVLNGTTEEVEAIMRIPVPDGAAVTRAVLEVDGKPMDGVFVDRAHADLVYKTIVSRRRDPLLVAWHDRGWIDVSLYPVPANGVRKFQIEWIEPIATSGKAISYRIPRLGHRGRVIRELDALKIFGKSLSASGKREISISGASPPEIAVGREPGEPFRFILARSRQDPSVRHSRVVIVADISGAMDARSRRAERLVLERLLLKLPKETEVRLLAVDWSVTDVKSRFGAGDPLDLLDSLDEIPSAGTFDLEHALLGAIDVAVREGASGVVFVGGGHDVFRRDALEAPMGRFSEAQIPLYAVGVGASSWALDDAAWMSGGLTANADDVSPIARSLVARSLDGPPTVGGVDAWHALETVTHETVWIGTAFGDPPAKAVRAAARDLGALWARAAHRPRRGEDDPGQKYRALTPFTSIIALENQGDYDEWQLPGPEPSRLPSEARDGVGAAGAITNVFGPGGLGTGINNAMSGARGVEAGTAPMTAPAAPRGLGIGIGGMGTHGHGSGSGYGNIDLGGRGSGVTRIVLRTTIVRGSLSKEQVSRVVRRNLARLKYCYEKQLKANPALRGEILGYFVIAPSGEVARASIRESSLNDENVESCLIKVMRSLRLPRPPKGDAVTVTYPLYFSNDNDGFRVPPSVNASSVRANCDLCPSSEVSRMLLADAEAGRFDSRVLAEIARIFEAPANLEREPLAWWIIQHRLRSSDLTRFSTEGIVRFPSPYDGWLGYVVAASLLRASEQDAHAERVLSEVAHLYPDEIERRMRAFGFDSGARRIMELVRRPL